MLNASAVTAEPRFGPPQPFRTRLPGSRRLWIGPRRRRQALHQTGIRLRRSARSAAARIAPRAILYVRADIYLLDEAPPALELGDLILVQLERSTPNVSRSAPSPATAVESRSRVLWTPSRGRGQRAGFVTMRKTMTITSIARIAPNTVPRSTRA
jgi:hypothetical protein